MEKNVYLNEERYENSKKKIKTFALIILVVGLLLGISLIAIGISNQVKTNSKYSEENKAHLASKIETEKQNIITKKAELEAKIKPIEDQIKKLDREPFTGFDDAYYEREDKIEELEKSIAADKKSIGVIEEALDESFNHCHFEAKNNTYTATYCSLKLQLDDINNDFNKSFDSQDIIPFYVFGGFVIILSCIIAGSIYMITKRREILAFSAQQVMPIAKETINTMTPTISNATKEMINTVSPSIGNAAKEIAKGIKEGLQDEEK